MLWVYLVGATTALVAAVGSIIYIETAAVGIAVPPQRVAASVQLTGSGSANLAVQHLDVDVSDTGVGTATKTISFAARRAVGQVTFLLVCPAILPAETCQPATLPAGSIVANAKGFRYVTEATAHFVFGKQTAVIGVHATAAGAAANTAPGTIIIIKNNPRSPALQVFNYYAVGGGADARVAHIIQQSDVDAVRVGLAAKVTDEVSSAMVGKAAGLTYFVDGPPALSFKSNRPVGKEAPFFTLTMTGKQGALAFSNDAAQAVLRASLQRLALPGYELAGPVHATYQLRLEANSVENLIWADAVGLAVPKIPMSTIRARLKGLTLADANSRLGRDFVGSTVEIRVAPLALPWLPIIPEHINLTVTLEPSGSDG